MKARDRMCVGYGIVVALMFFIVVDRDWTAIFPGLFATLSLLLLVRL